MGINFLITTCKIDYLTTLVLGNNEEDYGGKYTYINQKTLRYNRRL